MAVVMLLRLVLATASKRNSAACLPRETTPSRGRPFSGADHVLAERFLGCFTSGHYDREFPAVHHRDAVRQSEDFVQLGAHQQDRFLLCARLEQLLMNELDRAHVNATRRL